MKASVEVRDFHFCILESVLTHCPLLLILQMSVDMSIHPPRVPVSPAQLGVSLEVSDVMSTQINGPAPLPFCRTQLRPSPGTGLKQHLL